MTISEAAAALQVSDTAIRNMIADGRLQVTRQAMHGTRQRPYISRASVETERKRREGEAPPVT